MITVKEIREEVEAIKQSLANVCTIEDCRNLRHAGYSEDEINVHIDGDSFDLKDAMGIYKDWNNTKIDGISVFHSPAIPHLYYDIDSKDVCFDVYDEDYDVEYNMLEDVFLDNLESEYSQALSHPPVSLE